MQSRLDENITLMQKLKDKNASIGIVGLGYVGVPLLLRYGQIGYKVIGFDINEERIHSLNSGQSDIAHIDNKKVSLALKNGFKATSDFN